MRLNIPKGNGLDASGANTDAGTDTSSASDSNINTGNGADTSGVDNGNSTLSNDPQANLTACIDDEEIPF